MEQSRAATREGTGSGSLQPILAGITTALVGFTSSSAIVIAGLRAAGSSLAGASPGADPAAWSAAVGAFLVVAVLILLTGLWRGLSDLIARIPAPSPRRCSPACCCRSVLPLCTP